MRVKPAAVTQDDIITYVARCLYVEYGRNVPLDVAKSKMADYFPRSYMINYGNGHKARDMLARAVVASFEKQGFSGYAVPAKYVSIVTSAKDVMFLLFVSVCMSVSKARNFAVQH